MKTAPDSEQKRYERLDRHVRTSNSIPELQHWDAIRADTRLSAKHNEALRLEIAARMRHLTGGKTCSAK
jgi:hypothetical protein